MPISLATYIYAYWTFVIVFAVTAVGTGIRLGWRQSGTLKQWRVIKLGSIVLGLTSLILIMINFAGSARAAIYGKGREDLFLVFVDLKSFIAVNMAGTCSGAIDRPTQKQTCWDMQNIDNQIVYDHIVSEKPIQRISNWQNNPDIDKFLGEVNHRIDVVNSFMVAEADKNIEISENTRGHLYILAALMLSLATAGSAGETAFQLRSS